MADNKETRHPCTPTLKVSRSQHVDTHSSIKKTLKSYVQLMHFTTYITIINPKD